MKLKCTNNKSYIISIVSVFYGREMAGYRICRSPPNSQLSDESLCSKGQNDVTEQVKNICNDKNSCNFTLEKETFGKDGCPNVFKYMFVEYECGKFLG